MKPLLISFHNRHRFVAAGFLGIMLATLVLSITAVAGDQDNATAKSTGAAS